MKKNIKYIIMHNPPEISDQELEKYKDFNSILKRSQDNKNKPSSSFIYLSTAIILVVAISISLFFYTAKQKKEEQKIVHASHQIILPKTNQTHFDTVNSKPTLSQTSEKGNNVLIKKSAPHLDKINSQDKSNPLKKHLSAKNTFTEALPKGGYPVLFEYFKNQLHYPESARVKGIEGTVMVEFYIMPNGKADQIEILQGIDPDLDKEAKRLIAQMPEWQPAEIDGNKISVRQTLPIIFTIEKRK